MNSVTKAIDVMNTRPLKGRSYRRCMKKSTTRDPLSTAMARAIQMFAFPKSNFATHTVTTVSTSRAIAVWARILMGTTCPTPCSCVSLPSDMSLSKAES